MEDGRSAGTLAILHPQFSIFVPPVPRGVTRSIPGFDPVGLGANPSEAANFGSMYLTQTSQHTGIAAGLDNRNAPIFRLTTFGGCGLRMPICVNYILPANFDRSSFDRSVVIAVRDSEPPSLGHPFCKAWEAQQHHVWPTPRNRGDRSFPSGHFEILLVRRPRLCPRISIFDYENEEEDENDSAINKEQTPPSSWLRS